MLLILTTMVRIHIYLKDDEGAGAKEKVRIVARRIEYGGKRKLYDGKKDRRWWQRMEYDGKKDGGRWQGG
jgi:hypothetical protein